MGWVVGLGVQGYRVKVLGLLDWGFGLRVSGGLGFRGWGFGV